MFSHIILYVLIEILPIWIAKEKKFTGVEMGDINENLLREVDVGEEIIDSDDKVSLKDKVWIEMKDRGWSCHVHQIVYVWSQCHHSSLRWPHWLHRISCLR